MFDWYGIVGDVNDKWVTVTYQQMTIVIEVNLKQIQINLSQRVDTKFNDSFFFSSKENGTKTLFWSSITST